MNPAPEGDPWIPNADIFVNLMGELIIEVELSHMRREDLELAVEEDRLCVTGKRAESADPSPENYLVRQIARGHFSCVVQIPDSFDISAAKANYLNGMLYVCMPPKATFSGRMPPPVPPRGGT